MRASGEDRQIKDAIRGATGRKATDDQRITMGEEIHQRKAHGDGGSKNKKRDFTFDQLKAIAKELFGGDE
jgi:hypothetical protein